MKEKGQHKKSRNHTKSKVDTEMLVVRRLDNLTDDLKKVTKHYGISNESQVVRMIIKEKANSI